MVRGKEPIATICKATASGLTISTLLTHKP